MKNENKNFNLPNLYINKKIDKQTLEILVKQILNQFGTISTINLVDSLKTLGFRYATNGGISIGIEDLKIPEEKDSLLKESVFEIRKINNAWKNSFVTDIERFQKIIDSWNSASESLKNSIILFFKDSDPLNSIYMIAFSGARGNISQVRQLIGMRGLMADQKGQIIDLPITTNFREGLSSSDYIISSYGARKGIVDTALRTADSGYLTRRLVEIGQDIVIREIDCFANQGLKFNFQFYKNFREALRGRVLLHSIVKNGYLTLKKNQILDEEELDKIKELKIKDIYIRSPITCKAYRSICQYCYGWNLAYKNLVNLGDSVGVIAGQSIGEPGTQMTMRTFHTGGIFTTEIGQQIKSKISGILIPLSRIKAISTRSPHGNPILKLENSVTFRILNWKNKTHVFSLLEGSFLYIEPNSFVKTNQIIADIPTSSSTTKLGNVRDFKGLLSVSDGEIAFGDLIVKHISKKNRVLNYNEKAGSIWILPGNLITFPNETQIFIRHQQLNKKKILGRIKITSSINGFLNYDFEKKQLRISNNFISTKNTINIEYKKNKNAILINSIFLPVLEEQYKFSINSTKTSFICEFLKDFNFFSELQKTQILKTNFMFSGNLKYSELSFNNLNEFIFLENGNGSLFLMSNKPWLFSLDSKNFQNQKKSNFAFPGEKLFNLINIIHLVFYKIIQVPNGRLLLLIFPIYQYQIKTPKLFENCFNASLNKSLLKTFNFQNVFYHGKNIPLEQFQNFNFYQKFKFEYPKNRVSNFSLSVFKTLKIIEQTVINVKNFFNGWILNNLKIELNFLIHNNQYIDRYTVLGYIEYYPIVNTEIYFIKKTKADKQHFLFICEEHISKIYIENFKKNYKKDYFFKKYKKIQKNLILKNPGFFLSKKNNYLILRKAIPFFLTKGAILRYGKNEFVKKGENFAILVNYRKQTEDIVQGLPKIEELIELRGNNQNAVLSEKPGIIYRIEKIFDSYEIEILEKETSTIYVLESIDDLIIKKFDFLSLGEPLTSGSINPHELLRIFCNFYYKTDGIIKGLYKSIYKLEQILVNSIQAIYKSQGIDISDKHLEIVVRQMNSNVEVRHSGDTPLVPGESIELFLLEDLNEILSKNNYSIPIFQPTLTGVTRSSLKGESFLSSSSFQETRKMLAEAAIEGKIDWLRSLKANVITGRPIPCGSGFYNYQLNFSHPEFFDLLKFFESRENSIKKTPFLDTLNDK